MPNLVNTLVSNEYRALLDGHEGLLVASAPGLTVSETEALRVEFDKAGARMRMVRNALARRALSERGFEFPADAFVGNVTLVFGSAEATIHAAKVLTSPAVRKAGKIALRGGVLDGSQLSASDAVLLADTPDKLTLRAQLLGVLQGPARGLASLLNALPSGVARVLQARIDSQASPAGDAEAS
ncbi:MAG TPA: 50S ribosomal protein L10 [Planctomycetota bacterium]|nr:50S ribosomal protein L10 [Planctomycetota bacterium]